MNPDEIVGAIVRYACAAERNGQEFLCSALVNLAMLVAAGEVPAGYDPVRGVWVEEEPTKRFFVGPMVLGGVC
jgi:hypothetical protein